MPATLLSLFILLNKKWKLSPSLKTTRSKILHDCVHPFTKVSTNDIKYINKLLKPWGLAKLQKKQKISKHKSYNKIILFKIWKIVYSIY
jgi:hypothetical protein